MILSESQFPTTSFAPFFRQIHYAKVVFMNVLLLSLGRWHVCLCVEQLISDANSTRMLPALSNRKVCQEYMRKLYAGKRVIFYSICFESFCDSVKKPFSVHTFPPRKATREPLFSVCILSIFKDDFSSFLPSLVSLLLSFSSFFRGFQIGKVSTDPISEFKP